MSIIPTDEAVGTPLPAAITVMDARFDRQNLSTTHCSGIGKDVCRNHTNVAILCVCG